MADMFKRLNKSKFGEIEKIKVALLSVNDLLIFLTVKEISFLI